MSRETQILDAAIQVLGGRGTRHLTHRAVDEAAGLPPGSTSNRFRTREALLKGVLRRILDLETQTWTQLAGTDAPLDPDSFAHAAGDLVRYLTTDGRALTLARYAIFVEAAHQPSLREQIADSLQRLSIWAIPLMAALGSRDPATHLRLLLSYIDGLLANQLVNPDLSFDPAPAIALMLRAMVKQT